MYKLRNIILVGLTMACVGCVTIPTEYESPFRKATNVRKVEEIGDNDYWQTPRETRIVNQGDCEDIALLLEDELKRKGIESTVCFGRIHKNDMYQHMWVEVNKNGTNYVLDAAMNHYEIKTDNRYIHEEGVIYHMMLDEYRKGEKMTSEETDEDFEDEPSLR